RRRWRARSSTATPSIRPARPAVISTATRASCSCAPRPSWRWGRSSTAWPSTTSCSTRACCRRTCWRRPCAKNSSPRSARNKKQGQTPYSASPTWKLNKESDPVFLQRPGGAAVDVDDGALQVGGARRQQEGDCRGHLARLAEARHAQLARHRLRRRVLVHAFEL